MKTVSSRADTSLDGQYRIATVSQLTGIPAPTIRVWESRHAVVQPVRSKGNVRLYRRADIERLLLVKAAVDAGHAISTVAGLSDKQIKARFQVQPAAAEKAAKVCCSVRVYGMAMASVLETAWKARTDVRVQTSFPALAACVPASLPLVDAVVVDAPVLRNDLLVALRQLRTGERAPVVIVVYGFGNRQVLSKLDNANIIALAAPVDPAQIARICQLGLPIYPAPANAFSQLLMRAAAPRRYADEFLYQLSQLPSKMQCECLNHLADLLRKLNAFEHYSLECESLNIKDAAIHAMVFSACGHCCELLEVVLQRLLAHEGIPEPRA